MTSLAATLAWNILLHDQEPGSGALLCVKWKGFPERGEGNSPDDHLGRTTGWSCLCHLRKVRINVCTLKVEIGVTNLTLFHPFQSLLPTSSSL